MLKLFGISLLAGMALLPAGEAGAQSPAKLPVVASFSILADLVRQVGGDRVDVSALVGPDGDAHSFQPSPADGKRLVQARLIVVNGLGYEGWMDRLVKASGAKGPVVAATAGIKPVSGGADAHAHGSHAGHRHRADPHAWQNVGHVKAYVANIRAGLVGADPAGREAFDANAAAYTAKLDALDAEIRAALARVPPKAREVITTHDAFAYFGEAYGIKFTAPQGVSTENAASAADVARIIRQVKARKIPAVFLENVSDPRLADRIAKESGAKIGGRLFSDALSGPDGPAPTYLEMMRHNLRILMAALAD